MDYKEKVIALLNSEELSKEQKEKLEAIFPELAELEDERIRKELIAIYSVGAKVNAKTGDIPDRDIVAWLEKLGEQNFDYEHADIPQKDFAPIEPKFKIGDWLQYRHAEPFLVKEITEQGYCNGDSCLPFEWEDEIHLWTIQDAKEGDVLYSIDSKQPFIYKERPQFSQARGYCCINKFGEFAIWNTSKCVICTDKYIPATNNQRDTLFSKMKEEGYEWDSEKKELKKIESKTLDADKVIAWLKHRELSCDDVVTTVIPDDSPTSAHHRVKWLSDKFIEQFKKDFELC